jgi:hypothetical protein
MTQDQDLPNLSLEPVERRTSPRGLIQGMTVTVMSSGPLHDRTFPVEEAGPVSLFLRVDAVTPFVVGQRYRIRVQYRGQELTCSTECVRTAEPPRSGVVLQLAPDELDAHAALVEWLEPSTVPPGPV